MHDRSSTRRRSKHWGRPERQGSICSYKPTDGRTIRMASGMQSRRRVRPSRSPGSSALTSRSVPHLFRRTYATLLYRAGMRVKAVQSRTLHASVDTLLRHYIDDNEDAATYLDKAFAVA